MAPPEHIIEGVHAHLFGEEAFVAADAEDHVALAALFIHVLHVFVFAFVFR